MNEFADDAEQQGPASPAETPAEPSGAEAEAAGDARPEATGHPVVDEVLNSLATLETVPVAEHVAVFESAHDRLRAALADAGNDHRG